MKNLFKNISFFLIITLSLSGLLNAKELALIVKQEGTKVYLDTSEFKIKPKTGDAFRIADWGEDIINPKTGKNLGRELKRQINGHIIQTEELYSIGQLETSQNVFSSEAEVFVSQSPLEQAKTQSLKVEQNGSVTLLPAMQTKNIEGKAKAAAAADIDGDGETELILAFEDDNSIKAFRLEGKELKQVYSVQVNPLRKIIALDAADVKGTGSAQVFASVYDSGAERFYSIVFEPSADTLEQTDTVRGIVKGISVQGGPRVLYNQEFNPATGAGPAAKLIYKDDAFTRGDTLNAPGFESIFGFNLFDFKENGSQNIIYTTPYNKLRLQFDKKGSFIDTPAGFDFSTTPNRLKTDNKVQRLYTSVAVFKNAEGKTIVGAVEHQAKMGLLADVFGKYSSAKLYFLNWTGNGFTPQASADIPGIVCDIMQSPFGPYKDAILVPFSSTAGQSALIIFDASAA